jgi:hypothetical protein
MLTYVGFGGILPVKATQTHIKYGKKPSFKGKYKEEW